MKVVKISQLLIRVVLILALSMCWLWGSFALYLFVPGPQLFKNVLVGVFVLLMPGIFLISRKFPRSLISCMVVFTMVILWWNTIQPTNQKDWAPDVAQISHGIIQGDTLTMQNVRNFDYVDENTTIPRWESRKYDLRKLEGIDLFLSYWASEHIAHTILSWDFGEDGHLAISIETRKDKTQEYSAVKGFFKQFGLSYVAATESDIIRLRTNVWKERVYLYRLLTTKEQAKDLLVAYLDEMNRLVDQPKFYNALTRNCTTTIRIHANAVRKDAPPPIDWRLILSGHVDELLYDQGGIERKMPFAKLRKTSRIDLVMQEKGDANYSISLGKLREKTTN